MVKMSQICWLSVCSLPKNNFIFVHHNCADCGINKETARFLISGMLADISKLSSGCLSTTYKNFIFVHLESHIKEFC